MRQGHGHGHRGGDQYNPLRMHARVAVLLVALAFLAALWFTARDNSEADDLATPRATIDDVAAAPVAVAPSPIRQAVEPAPLHSPAPEPSLALLPIDRPRATLNLRVVDARGSPLAGARIRSFAAPGTTHDLLAFDDGRGALATAGTDADGRASFADLAFGAWWLIAERDRHLTRRRLHHTGETEHRIVLDIDGTAAQLRVHVAGVDGVGVADALVELSGGGVKGALPQDNRLAAPIALTARTDQSGTAIIDDPGFAGFVAVARAADGRCGTATAWTTQGVANARHDGIDIVVDRPGTLSGAVRPADDLHDARVVARLLNNPHPHHTTHGAAPIEVAVTAGRYRFEALPAARYSLALVDSRDARLALPQLSFGAPLENSIDPLEVEVKAGAETVQDLDIERGGAIEGIVRAPDAEAAAPLAGAVVRATFAPRTSNFPDGLSLHGANVWRFDSDTGGCAEHPDSHAMTTTDAHGRYRLGGLAAGRHRLEVAFGGRRYDVRAEVAVRSGETVRLEHVLERAGAIEGVLRRGSYLGVARPGETQLRMVAILPGDGLFAFSGLEPGAWVLSAVHSDTGIGLVPLVTVTVEAGRTTWIDVDAEAAWPVKLTGRVRDNAAPIAGARVMMGHREWKTTDTQGRFEFGVPFASSFQVPFRVVHEHVDYGFKFAGMPNDATRWDGDLVLGDEQLVLVTRDALGMPAVAEISLSGRAAGRAEIESVRASATTPPTGELALEHLAAGEYDVAATFADGSIVNRALALPATAPLVLQAPATGEIEILVRTHEGKPAAGRTVVATTWLGDGPMPADAQARNANSAFRSETTAADGRALLRGVTAGTVRVETHVTWGTLHPVQPPQPHVVELAVGGRAAVVFDELPN